MRKVRFALPFLLLAALASGCGSNYLKVKGRITKGGQPFTKQEEGVFRITFVPTESQSATRYDSYPARYNPEDGSFQVVGNDGRGLPPGKYKVGLELLKKKNDVFKGAYMGHSSPFAVEIDRNTKEIVVDLDKAGEAS